MVANPGQSCSSLITDEHTVSAFILFYAEVQPEELFMDNIITDAEKDPMGAMLLDTFHGETTASLEVSSPCFEMTHMTGQEMLRSYSTMNRVEQKALALCQGRVLDVGAGSGCHSLYLQEQGSEVHAIDISLGSVQVMQLRGVENAYHRNIYGEQHASYDTLLMLMNGLGICGTLDGLNLLLQHAQSFLAKGGTIIADSTDLRSLLGEVDDASGYYGETEFVMCYKGKKSAPFPWLYVDFETLSQLVTYNRLQCEQVIVEPSGHYLVAIYIP